MFGRAVFLNCPQHFWVEAVNELLPAIAKIFGLAERWKRNLYNPPGSQVSDAIAKSPLPGTSRQITHGKLCVPVFRSLAACTGRSGQILRLLYEKFTFVRALFFN